MQKRFVLFLILSAIVLFGWDFILRTYFLPKPSSGQKVTPSSAPTTPNPSASSVQPLPLQAAPPSTPSMPAEVNLIKLRSPFWKGTLSNRGGVLTEWTMTHFLDGKPIDEDKGGVNLVSAKLSQEIGAPLRILLPSDKSLENELNSALYVVENLTDREIDLSKGEQREIVFYYAQNGITARKRFVLNGSGFDFEFQIEVKRNGQLVDAQVVIGPSFGDQSIKEFGFYSPEPYVSYVAGGEVNRVTASSKGPELNTIQAANVVWAAVDDNYFAMAFLPSSPATFISVINHLQQQASGSKGKSRNYISVAIPVKPGQTNYIYAGPKVPAVLNAVSQKLGIVGESMSLEGLINYGYMAFMIKPLAQFLIKGLNLAYGLTGNYGWAIVIFTVILNMFFFPLRWKSSVSMKRTAALQPKMKDLQERMKRLEKNDPRMKELQMEQIALMREGNPFMGCLPLLLQMPFFYAVFVILTVAIEMRHAPFFGWIQDLSSPDKYYILPIVMCVTMLVQQALTPSPADPVQKKIGYLMPLIFTGMFFIYAPAGLVLYWMVGNLVGIGQQYVINRMNPPQPGAPATAEQPKPDEVRSQPRKRKKAKQLLANS